MMAEIARQPLTDTHIDTKYAEALEYATGRNEVFFLPFLARGAFKLLHLPRPVLAGGVLATTIFATQGVESKGYVDLDKAETEVTSDLIKFTPQQKFETAVAYFSQTMRAEKVNYEVDVNVPIKGDIVPDCEGNTEMQGIGVLRFGLPFDAITSSRGANGKTDFTVDSSKLTVAPNWYAAGPVFKDYTINSGGRNYDDRSGTCRSVTEALAGAARVVNINGISNLMEDTRANVQKDMKLKGLNVLVDSCAPELDVPNKEAIREALIATVVKMGRIEDLNTDNITFTDEKLKWKVDKLEVPTRIGIKYKMGPVDLEAFSKYAFGKEPTIDKVTCNVDPAVVEKGGAS